jgi:transcriptional regulator with XRE-family HTH domain
VSKKQDSGGQETLGERLRRLRKARGFTQTELAQAIGSSQRMITYYERHDGIPAAPVLLKLAETLGATPEELLGIETSRRRLAAPQSPENLRLWRKLKQVEKLSPPERRDVVRFIEALVERNALKKQKAS